MEVRIEEVEGGRVCGLYEEFEDCVVVLWWMNEMFWLIVLMGAAFLPHPLICLCC